ncbi:glycosyltransferase [Flavobacterium sp.]|jgi:glycosyltransferase involved in cell wall biosynthesis|uniref:glycosyltransferase n=1 Tax=Flavobacterium sp. TaxID=239 RepID=UPI0037BF440E
MKIVIIVNSRDFNNTAGMNKVILHAMPELQNIFQKVIIVSCNNYLELFIGLFKIVVNNPFSIDFFIFNSLASIRKEYNKFWVFLYNFSTIFKIKKAIYWHEMPNYFKIFNENPKYKDESKQIIKKFSNNKILHLNVSESCSKIVDFFNKEAPKNIIYNCVKKNENIHNINFDKFTITTVGSIQDIKGTDIWVEVAIKVCKQNDRVQFIWCGSILDKELFDKCVTLITNNGLQDRIRFVGTIESAYFVISASHLLYSSSRIDSFPLSIIEAMAYGKNIIYYESGGIEEAVGDLGFKIRDFDIDKTVEIINNFIENYYKGNFKMIDKRLIEKYYSNYTPQIFVNNLFSILKENSIRQ